jgi:hypothetical protein
MIDINYKVYSDTPKGRDPNYYSPILRKYHQLLWSKALPSGNILEMEKHLSDHKLVWALLELR